MKRKTTKADKTRTGTKSRHGRPKMKWRTAPSVEVAATQSVIKQKYRERYEDGSCGDRLARKLRKHPETVDGTIDLDKLQALAERNTVWKPRYASPTLAPPPLVIPT